MYCIRTSSKDPVDQAILLCESSCDTRTRYLRLHVVRSGTKVGCHDTARLLEGSGWMTPYQHSVCRMIVLRSAIGIRTVSVSLVPFLIFLTDLDI
jgi:hypothetical protein